jgi:hypothetical protein
MMKKVVLFGIFLISLNLNGQVEITEYGPRAGNFGVGIAANPFFQYIGNFFGKTHVNTAPSANLASNYHLFGKYFTSDNSALRAGLHLNYGVESTFFGPDDENRLNETALLFGLALGFENRFGSERIQGFFGPSLGVGYSTERDIYSYDATPVQGSILERSYGTDLSFALGGFAGVEYFIWSNFAIGTELGLGLNVSTSGKGRIEYQGMDDAETGTRSREINIGFNDTPAQLAPRGTIYLSLYF